MRSLFVEYTHCESSDRVLSQSIVVLRSRLSGKRARLVLYEEMPANHAHRDVIILCNFWMTDGFAHTHRGASVKNLQSTRQDESTRTCFTRSRPALAESDKNKCSTRATKAGSFLNRKIAICRLAPKTISSLRNALGSAIVTLVSYSLFVFASNNFIQCVSFQWISVDNRLYTYNKKKRNWIPEFLCKNNPAHAIVLRFHSLCDTRKRASRSTQIVIKSRVLSTCLFAVFIPSPSKITSNKYPTQLEHN